MRSAMVAAWLAAVLAAAGCSGGESEAKTPSPSATPSARPVLQDAARQCGASDDVLADKGRSMTLDTIGEDDDIGDSQRIVDCALNITKAPEFVRQHIQSTRALDGQQTDTWEGFEARWTYHPDDGLQITLIDRS